MCRQPPASVIVTDGRFTNASHGHTLSQSVRREREVFAPSLLTDRFAATQLSSRMAGVGRTETFAALKSPTRRGPFLLLALPLSPPRSGGALSARQDGALLYPGPLGGGEAGTKGPQGSRQEVDSFSPAHGCAVEKPGPGSRTCRAGMPGKRQVGVSFSLGYFSFGQAKEKYLARRRRTKALDLCDQRVAGSTHHARASHSTSQTKSIAHRVRSYR